MDSSDSPLMIMFNKGEKYVLIDNILRFSNLRAGKYYLEFKIGNTVCQTLNKVITIEELLTRSQTQKINVLFIVANFAIDKPEALISFSESAKDVGANAVVFTDSKLEQRALDDSAGSLWLENMRNTTIK